MPLPHLAEKIPVRLRGRLGLGIAALLGLALAVALSHSLRRAETRAIHQEIERRVSVVHDLLLNNIHDYDSALHGLRLLVNNSTEISPQEFQRSASDTLARAPGI